MGWRTWLTIAAACAAGAGPAAARTGFTRGVANADLVAAAKATPLRLIDYDEELCRNDRTVEAWLTELTGEAARAIAWSGGPCVLVSELNPIDAGGSWCAQATVTLRHPKDRTDRPMVEIFFEAPTHGRPGPAYAFRGDLGEGPIRFRRDFEQAWLERFPATAAAINCPEAN